MPVSFLNVTYKRFRLQDTFFFLQSLDINPCLDRFQIGSTSLTISVHPVEKFSFFILSLTKKRRPLDIRFEIIVIRRIHPTHTLVHTCVYMYTYTQTNSFDFRVRTSKWPFHCTPAQLKTPEPRYHNVRTKSICVVKKGQSIDLKKKLSNREKQICKKMGSFDEVYISEKTYNNYVIYPVFV